MTPDHDRDPDVLAAALRGLGFGLCGLAADGIIRTWDATATRLTGFRVAEVQGRPLAALDGADGCLRAVLDALRVGEPATTPFAGRVRARGDRALAVEGVATLVRGDDGAARGALLAFRPRSDADAPEPLPASAPAIDGLVGDSDAMREVTRRVRLAARSDVTTLVLGESGTGKEVVARAIHDLSERRERPFVAVNCAALPEAMLEAELFGHVRGAFTGAVRERKGLIETAHGGTLFLDEIGDLGPRMQVKLLRALQEREVRPVGGDRVTPVDVRLVTATNRDLQQLLADGGMREDFYYRIRVYEVVLPPLRERLEDVPMLADWFVRRQNERTGRRIRGITKAALRVLLGHPWPGNVRELRNAIEHAFVTAEGDRIDVAHLPPELQRPPAADDAGPARPGAVSARDAAERDRVLAELDLHDWNRTETAKALGYSRVTLWKKMRKYGIDEGVFRRPGVNREG